MGQVYGRISLASASSRSPSGDHHTSCPSKAKPDCRGAKMGSSASGPMRRRRRSSVSSNEDDDEEDDNQLSIRMTRQASRQLAIQQAAQQAASVRRSVRLAGAGRQSTSGGSRSANYRSGQSLSCAGAATLPSTLRRSARIAGFRYIGHRVAADFSSSSSSSSAARQRRAVSASQSAPVVSHQLGRGRSNSSSAAIAPELRRSARLVVRA